MSKSLTSMTGPIELSGGTYFHLYLFPCSLSTERNNNNNNSDNSFHLSSQFLFEKQARLSAGWWDEALGNKVLE